MEEECFAPQAGLGRLVQSPPQWAGLQNSKSGLHDFNFSFDFHSQWREALFLGFGRFKISGWGKNGILGPVTP